MRVTFLLILYSISFYAQKDTIQLKEVLVLGTFSKKNHCGYNMTVIKDSILHSYQSLKEVLQQEVNVYFKEYGNGMVSSISMRGSGASHTAVYFNGIAINSVLNGQTDFNTVNVTDFNSIVIKRGAGSTSLGSGAIGGAINLQDKIQYKTAEKINIFGGFGSFSTFLGNAQFHKSNAAFYQKHSVSYEQSDNDYLYLKTNQVNKNGAYSKFFEKSVLGYKFKENKELNLFTTFSNNNRNLSGSLTAPNFSKLIDKNIRVLMRYKVANTILNQTFDLAYLSEKYQFYLFKDTDDFSFGKANSVIAKYHFNYFVNNKVQFFGGLDGKFITAKGSNIEKQQNQQAEAFFVSHLTPNKKLQCNISLRKGVASNFNIPFIYSVDASYTLPDNFLVKANYSTNYRLPTINDLYWNPGGNPNLKPENNTSYETSLNYAKNSVSASISLYYTKSKNLIQWQPVTTEFWQPFNVQNVVSNGLETTFSYQFNKWNFTTMYSYAKSEDTNLHQQLIYVPMHQAMANISYKLQKWQFFLTQQYVGKVFTTSSNSQVVPAYYLANFRLNRSIPKLNTIFGLNVNNILNSYYEVIAYRPMPNRNFQITINVQF